MLFLILLYTTVLKKSIQAKCSSSYTELIVRNLGLKEVSKKCLMMSVFHDEIEIEDMEYDEENELYHYPCPCGDRFEISMEDLENGEDVAKCPSCSLIIKVIYDQEDFMAGEKVQVVKKTELALA